MIFENITNEYEDTPSSAKGRKNNKKRKKFSDLEHEDDDDDSFKGDEDDDEEEEYSVYLRKKAKGSSKKMREETAGDGITNAFIPPTTIFKGTTNDSNEEKEYQFASTIPSIFSFSNNTKKIENFKIDENQVLSSTIKDQFFTPILGSNSTSESHLFSLIAYGKMKRETKEKGIYKYNDRSRDFLLDTTNIALQARRKLLINLRSGVEDNVRWALNVLLHQSIYGPFISLSAPKSIECDESNTNFVVSVAIFNCLLDLVQYKVCPIESFKRSSDKILTKNQATRYKEQLMDESEDRTNNKNHEQRQILRDLFSPRILPFEVTKHMHVISLINNLSNTDEPTLQYLATEKRLFDLCSHLFSVLRIKVPITSFSFRVNKTFPDNVIRNSETDLCAKDEAWNDFVVGINQLPLEQLKKISILALDMLQNVTKYIISPNFDVRNFLRSLLYFFHMDDDSVIDQTFRIFANLFKFPEILSLIPLTLSGDNQSDPTFYNRLLSLVKPEATQNYNEIIFDHLYNLSKIGKIFSDSFSLSDGVSILVNFILYNSFHDHENKNVNLCRRIILTLQNLASSSMLNQEKLKATKESLLSIVANEYPISTEILDIILTFCEQTK